MAKELVERTDSDSSPFEVELASVLKGISKSLINVIDPELAYASGEFVVRINEFSIPEATINIFIKSSAGDKLAMCVGIIEDDNVDRSDETKRDKITPLDYSVTVDNFDDRLLLPAKCTDNVNNSIFKTNVLRSRVCELSENYQELKMIMGDINNYNPELVYRFYKDANKAGCIDAYLRTDDVRSKRVKLDSKSKLWFIVNIENGVRKLVIFSDENINLKDLRFSHGVFFNQ